MRVVKDLSLTIGYYPGQYVKVDKKFKGYVMDCSGVVTVLATSGETGIHHLDPRLHEIKVIRDRTPEGIADTRRDLKKTNIKASVLVLVPLSLYIGFAIGMPFIGVGGMGLVLITAAFLDDDNRPFL